MSDDASLSLTEYLTKHYTNLRRRLTRVLGNGDLAGDALQDTWIRLQAKAGQSDEGPVNSPAGYLVRVAVNIAVDIQRRQSRHVSFDEVSALLDQADPAPNPAQAAEIRSDLDQMVALMERLPPRRRQILIMVRLEQLQQKEVAKRMGVSVSVVEHELRRAHEFMDQQLARYKK